MVIKYVTITEKILSKSTEFDELITTFLGTESLILFSIVG